MLCCRPDIFIIAHCTNACIVNAIWDKNTVGAMPEEVGSGVSATWAKMLLL